MRNRVLRAPDLSRLCIPCRVRSGIQSRNVQILTSQPASPTTGAKTIHIPDPSASQPTPDAHFEILGGHASLLSASVSPSQNLYTRRGTLVGFSGRAENALSTLSVLEPFVRAVGGIPFLYQKITSTSPLTALIGAKSPSTTFTVIHLDGRQDWMVARRDALLAWTGHTLSLRPQINTSMSVAHWGNTKVTGRGMLCLSGRGQIHQVMARTGEEFVVHPSNLLAYSITSNAPQPYRFKSSSLRLQIPNPVTLLPDTRFVRTIRDSQVWKFVVALAFTARTWARRSIFGDRLFLRFEGPANILVQSRGNGISEVLTNRDVNEIADSPAGAVVNSENARLDAQEPSRREAEKPVATAQPTKSSVASIGADAKVTFAKGGSS